MWLIPLSPGEKSQQWLSVKWRAVSLNFLIKGKAETAANIWWLSFLLRFVSWRAVLSINTTVGGAERGFCSRFVKPLRKLWLNSFAFALNAQEKDIKWIFARCAIHNTFHLQDTSTGERFRSCNPFGHPGHPWPKTLINSLTELVWCLN